MAVNQSPACGREVQSTRAPDRVSGAEQRCRLKEISLMHQDRGRWWIGTSIASTESQSRWAVALATAAMELWKWAGRGFERRILETKDRVSTTELTQAAGACKTAHLRPRPPRKQGGEDFRQLQSERGPLTSHIRQGIPQKVIKKWQLLPWCNVGDTFSKRRQTWGEIDSDEEG